MWYSDDTSFYFDNDGIDRIFVHDSRIGPEMFEGEALGLKAMYDTKSIRVPLPYKVREVADSGIFTGEYLKCFNINTWSAMTNTVIPIHNGNTHIVTLKASVLVICAARMHITY